MAAANETERLVAKAKGTAVSRSVNVAVEKKVIDFFDEILEATGRIDVLVNNAGITKDTSDPPGGGFDRNEDGTPNGICREGAGRLARRGSPPPPSATREEKLNGYRLCFQNYLSKGIVYHYSSGGGLFEEFTAGASHFFTSDADKFHVVTAFLQRAYKKSAVCVGAWLSST